MKALLRKVLVANRGEIAVRILASCRRMGLATVAVYSDADAEAPHVAMADEAVRLGPPAPRESYLNIERIVAAARATGADAVHPGYGFLSESAGAAARLREAGLTFVGPPAFALETFGDKVKARALARSVGVAPPPGSAGLIDHLDVSAAAAAAASVGYPVLVKAAGGGGGMGMQKVDAPEELARALETCASRGQSAFGDSRVYLERYLTRPRHIEVQVMCDRHGGAYALGERECSVQRRHQKIIEESPSPAAFLSGEGGRHRREALFDAALRIVVAAHYEGAGTVEFVADATGELYFLEVNARLQVEHPVTEMVTGLDLVELQLCVAAGERLPATLSSGTRPGGHAVEARLYAEDPQRKFMPQPGRLAELVWPGAREGVRVDAGVREGSEVTPYYDPMIAKVIGHAPTRDEALARLDRALAETRISLAGNRGPRATNIAFLRKVLADARFRSGEYDTSLAESLASA